MGASAQSDSELLPQEQVLEHERLTATERSAQYADEERDPIEHGPMMARGAERHPDTVLAPYNPDKWHQKTLDRLGVRYAAEHTGGAAPAATRLSELLDAGRPCIIRPDRYHLGYWRLPSYKEGQGGPDVVVYAQDADGVRVDDRNVSPLLVPREKLAARPRPRRLLQEQPLRRRPRQRPRLRGHAARRRARWPQGLCGPPERAVGLVLAPRLA